MTAGKHSFKNLLTMLIATVDSNTDKVFVVHVNWFTLLYDNSIYYGLFSLHMVLRFPFSADEARVKEFGLKSMWRSPNGTIRNILNGLYLINLVLPYFYEIFHAFNANNLVLIYVWLHVKQLVKQPTVLFSSAWE